MSYVSLIIVFVDDWAPSASEPDALNPEGGINFFGLAYSRCLLANIQQKVLETY